MQLTPSQQKAVRYSAGPLLIIAGAGTGKTTVLVEKIKFLIKKKRAHPNEILALTFTEKAAQEMEERVDKALPYGYFAMNISTFHSFCDTLLRREGMHIGMSPGYRLFTQAQIMLFLKKNLFQFNLDYFRPLGNPTKFLEGLMLHFSRLRDEDISPEDYIQWTQKLSKKKSISHEEELEAKKYHELSFAYQTFQRLKLNENILDFSDLIYYSLQLLRARKNILMQQHKEYKYILIDEFQDTNIAQYNLIKLLAPPTQKRLQLTVIGDDNQSIYKFRGASVSNILQFRDDYPASKKVILTENFRSRQSILDSSYRLIKHNDPDTLEARLNISKNLRSTRHKGHKSDVQFFLSDRVDEEAGMVVDHIDTLKKKYALRNMAILVRANNHIDPFVKALAYADIPFQIHGSASLYKEPEIKDLIAFLQSINDLTDSPSMHRLISMDIFNIDYKDIALLLSFTKKTALSLFETIEIYLSFFYPEIYQPEFAVYQKYMVTLSARARAKLHAIYSIIQKALSMAKKETAGKILFMFLEESGLMAKLMDESSAKANKTTNNIAIFFDKLKSFELEHDDASVVAVCDFLSMSMELGESPLIQHDTLSEKDAINILTVHAAKGLEFDVVYLVNLVAERFPTRNRNQEIPIPEALIKENLPVGDFHLQEERRLFYVAATRARDKLYLYASQYYGDAKRSRKISPFVFEMLGENIIAQKLNLKKEEKKQLSFFDPFFLKKSTKAEMKPIEQKTPTEATFSYSQLETYKLCPLKYKYQYVLKIPTPTNAAASFGETIHKVFELAYQKHKQGEKISKKILHQLYMSSWIPIGYSSKSHERTTQLVGSKLLDDYFEKYHNEHTVILDTERWFRLKLDPNTTIIGKIDRVDRGKDGGLEIIDYKTGKKPTLPELKKNLQLGIYALAAKDKGLYNTSPDKVTLTFYFLQQDEAKVSLSKSEEDLMMVKEEIKKIITDIRGNNFSPKTGPWCKHCPFKINCEAWQ